MTTPATRRGKGPASALGAALRVRGLLLRRRLQHEAAGGVNRLLGLGAITIAIAAMIVATTYACGRYVVARGAPELLLTGVSAGLLGLCAALVLSSVGHAAQAFLSAKDLWFWDASPAPRWAHFIDRTIETAIAALPTTLALGGLALSGLVLGGGLGALAALRVALVVGLVGIVPLSLGVALAHCGGAFLPAGRLRRLSLLILGGALAILLVWFRRARVERALTPEGAAELLEGARGAGLLGPAVLPSSLGARLVVHAEVDALVGLGAWVVACLVGAFVLHAALARRARDLAVDESPTGMIRGGGRERLMTWLVKPVPAEVRPLVQKDLLAFVRDPGQWGQVVLLLGVGVLYLVNADALRQGFANMPQVGAAVLPAMHTGLVTFIAAGLAVRFAFPQVGLEGPAIWILEGAPLRPHAVLFAKWLASLPVVVVYPTAIAVAGGLVLELRPGLWAITSALCAIVAAGVAAYGVGRGAEKPLLDAASLSELAMGPGALSTMLWSVVLAGAAALGALVAGACWVALLRGRGPGELLVPLIVVSTALPAVVAIAAGRRVLKRGTAAYDRRRLDGGERQPLHRDTSSVATDA